MWKMGGQMDKELLNRYADLILSVGINLQQGDNLLIRAEPIHLYFVDILEKLAYEKGARFIRFKMTASKSTLNRVSYQKEEYLDYIPSDYESTVDAYVDEGWCVISIEGMEDPDIFSEMDQERFAKMQKPLLEKSKKLMRAAMSGPTRWTIAPLPTPGWAAKVFAEKDSKASTEKLWQCLIPILRLNSDNPTKLWKEHLDGLKKRTDYLDSLQLDHLHFEGEGTDLKVYLGEKSCWIGGSLCHNGGLPFLANIPTEEVFSTPDFRKTNGRVQVTRPVKVSGKSVIGSWFEFKNGTVVDFGAQEGKAALEQFFKMDPNAKALGEVALVDVESPIFKTNKIFDSILLDENASCHIALGRGIPLAIVGGDKMDEEQLKDCGCNHSLLHTDFMIGSKQLKVTGIGRDGTKTVIIETGRFTI